MVNILKDCLILGFLFLFVGVDIFGFWDVIVRCIRGGLVISKRWVILFMCLVLRGIYIEFGEELSMFCFINVLRCFLFIRGFVC